jgi:malonyl CoA-acyl carrier protein transacylase
MDNLRERIEKLSPNRLALLALELQSRIEDLERRRTEPIAIIGMGCRVPGADAGLDGFWHLLEEGRDTITEIPRERWDAAAYYAADPDAPGRMATRWGGFLNDIAGFDASFFGISRREAESMDPQQRMLLEICWEALEDAGYCPRKAAGGSVGVFAGITTTDYHSLMLERGEETINVHTATGSGNCIAAGRISYVLGLEGPNLAVDTACSSSLTAVHLACQSLRSDECRIALAAGVNALLAPELFIALTKAHALAEDGRCKTFDARADGFARAEGCGVVVLKRMSHALADGDRILALIRGSALNQDGRSSGMTAPNGAAQEAVIRQALATAGIAPEAVDYVEAHGTGTALGDPIEAHALAAVLGPNRLPDHPLVLGSVKTNFGHLEAAAGVVGLIKVVLALQHGMIPRHLHFQSLNPHIDWKGMPVVIPARAISWQANGKRRIAGVNSFGLSGTNAHVIIEEPPAREARVLATERPLHLLTLSARSEAALQALRERFGENLARAHSGLGDICYTAGAGRAHFEHRAAYIAPTMEAMREALAGEPAAAGCSPSAPQVAFLFPGQGSQYRGMARGLYQTQPVVRQVLDECADLLRGHLKVPLLDVLWEDSSHLIDQTAYTQPALFAVEYALARLWMSWGVEPTAALGHSVGEYVAACVAGVFSLEDGLEFIAKRASLMQNVSGEGAMAAVLADEERTRKALAGFEGRVAIAALNAPANTVISGYRRELEQVQQALENDGIIVQRLAVSHAFHSPQMREMETAFEDVAATIHCQGPRLHLISSVTGKAINEEMTQPSYWRRQVSQAVRFREAMQTLEKSGYRTFLEIGPGTTLAALGRQCTCENNSMWLPSLRKSRGDWAQMLDSVAHLYGLGFNVDWEGFDKPYSRVRVALPTYPFEREHYWFENRSSSQRAPGRKTLAGENIEDWFYKLAWEKKDPERSQAKKSARWLIVSGGGGVAEEFAKTLRESGANVVIALAPPDEAFDFVVHDALLNHDDPLAALTSAIATAQAVIAGQSGARLWLITRGAQQVLSADAELNLTQAPLWGFGRTYALEHPGTWGGLVDLDPAMTCTDMAAALFDAIACHDREDQVAFRHGERYVARLLRHPVPAPPRVSLASGQTYLITGGAGGLGVKLCLWMAEQGARHLMILGRRAPSADAAQALADLRNRGVSVEFRIADVTRKPELEAVFSEFGKQMPKLGGVIHAAGVLDDKVIANLTPESAAKVLAPKTEGAWNLHQLTATLPLDFFVLFSSLASVTGSPGQAGYASANSFLDGLAHFRSARGLPAVSVNWGGWTGAGMAARVDAEIRHRTGPFQLMHPEAALNAFGRLVSGAPPQIAVAQVAWEEFENFAGARETSPVFSAMLRPAAPPKRPLEELNALPPEALRPALVSYLTRTLAPILAVQPEAITPGRGIVDYGLDSLMALEFRNRISADLQLTVPTAALLQGPSLEALANEIAPKLSERRSEGKPAPRVVEFPLSYSQKLQWFGHKMAPGSSTFNIGFAASISPCVEWKAFERAVARLVERHPALRTVVIEKDDQYPTQRILASSSTDLTLIDASAWEEEELKRRVHEEFVPGFAIDKPMVRIRVFRSAERDVILFAVDHLIIDAASGPICFEDLRAFYCAELEGTDPLIEPLEADYHDFVEWEAAQVEGPGSERLWNYWKSKLHGELPVLQLPSTRERPSLLLPKGDNVQGGYSPELSDAIYQVAREHRTTPFTVFLTVFQVLLKMYSGQDDIIIGTSVSRRDDPRWSKQVGLFINVVPLRADLSGDPTFARLLANSKETVLGAMAHQEFPISEIVNRLRLPRSMRRTPIFQAFLNFLIDRSTDLGVLMLPNPDASVSFGPSKLRPFMTIPQQEGQSEIVLLIGQLEGQFVGNLSYNTDIVEREIAELINQSYFAILGTVAREPNRPISELISQAATAGGEREEVFF